MDGPDETQLSSLRLKAVIAGAGRGRPAHATAWLYLETEAETGAAPAAGWEDVGREAAVDVAQRLR